MGGPVAGGPGAPDARTVDLILAEARRLFEDHLTHFGDLEKKATWLAGAVAGALAALVGLGEPSDLPKLLPYAAPLWLRVPVWLVGGAACLCIALSLVRLVQCLQVSRVRLPDPYKVVRREYALYPVEVVSTLIALEYAQAAKSLLPVLRRKAAFYGRATVDVLAAAAAVGLFGLLAGIMWMANG